MEVSEPDQRGDGVRHPFWDRVRDEIAVKVAAGMVTGVFAVVSLVFTPVREATWGRILGVGESGDRSSERSPEPPPASEEPSSPASLKQQENPAVKPDSPKRVRLGEAVPLGELHFTPREFVCGLDATSAGENNDPQGQFCRLSFDFRNDGNTPQALPFATKFRLYVGDDHYSGRDHARAVFPDSMGTGFATFDIPPGVAPSRLQFWYNDFNYATDDVVFELVF